MQVMKHLRMPADIGIQNISRELEREAHCVAVVVVRDVLAPVEKIGVCVAGMRHVPAEEVDHAVAAIYFDNRRDESNQVVANVSDVRALVHGETIRKLHQSGG